MVLVVVEEAWEVVKGWLGRVVATKHGAAPERPRDERRHTVLGQRPRRAGDECMEQEGRERGVHTVAGAEELTNDGGRVSPFLTKRFHERFVWRRVLESRRPLASAGRQTSLPHAGCWRGGGGGRGALESVTTLDLFFSG